ncbi:MAG: anti-sigma factor family protein [Cyclobacteriaceae bacterium]
MKTFGEEDIFKYLDNELTPEQRLDFEGQLEASEAFKKQFEEASIVHESLSRLNTEAASPSFTDQVMQKVSGQTRSSSYLSSGLGGLNFIILSGVLTGLVAIASLFISGYLDYQVIQEGLQQSQWSKGIDLGFLAKLLDKKSLTIMIVVIYTILSFILLDRAVITPWLMRKSKKVNFRML